MINVSDSSDVNMGLVPDEGLLVERTSEAQRSLCGQIDQLESSAGLAKSVHSY